MAQSSLSELLDHMAKPFAHAYQIKAEALQYCSTMADLCDLLLELGHHRETSKLSIQLGDLCIRLGERVDGSEHKEYLLWVISRSNHIMYNVCNHFNTTLRPYQHIRKH